MFNINPRPSLLWNLFKYPAGGIAQSWKFRTCIYSMQAITLISIFNLSFLHIVNQLFFATTLFHSQFHLTVLWRLIFATKPNPELCCYIQNCVVIFINNNDYQDKFAARNIRNDESLSNLVEISHTPMQVDLQYRTCLSLY